MKLKLFKTLWGFEGSYEAAVKTAVEQGYDGIEAPVPKTIKEAEQFSVLLEQHQLMYIAEIATTGTYVPDRRLSMQDHLNDLKDNFSRLQHLKPLFITCLGGCDAWRESDSLLFFKKAINIADEFGVLISFETHRGRILFNPWVTKHIVKEIPEIKLTCDFSHWCVVCEGLQETEAELIYSLLPNAWHVHGRVGYDQGPQVPDPRIPLYKNDLEKHGEWWQWIWSEHHHQGKNMTTVTPEFGRDGYEYRDLDEGLPLINVDEINVWIAGYLRSRFEQTFSHAT